jgi:hypothetical protein
MGTPIRGEMWKLAIAPEAAYGTDPGTAAYKLFPGLFTDATLPDPDIDFQPHYFLGSSSKRNWYIAYKGRMTMAGSIPNITLLNGQYLYLPVGTMATTGADKAAGGGGTFSAMLKGATSGTISDATNWSTNDICQIGTGATAEVRKVSVSGTTLTFDYPLCFAHGNGTDANEVQAPYTHTVTESVTLESFGLHATLFDADGTAQLMRRWLGGKVNRATISASEGDFLKYSIDEMVFINHLNDQIGEPFYSATVADISPVYPTTEPYLFSYGVLSLGGSVFARVRAFRLGISNDLVPKYYVSDTSAINQLPVEYREGHRRYEMSVDVDIEDATLYKELVRQGSYSSVYKGFQISIVFTRGSNDTITLTTPSASPAAGGDAMGCLIMRGKNNIMSGEPLVHVPLDILCRNLSIVTVDSVPSFPLS